MYSVPLPHLSHPNMYSFPDQFLYRNPSLVYYSTPPTPPTPPVTQNVMMNPFKHPNVKTLSDECLSLLYLSSELSSVYNESSLSKRRKKVQKIFKKRKEEKKKSRSPESSAKETIQPSSYSVDKVVNSVEEIPNSIVVSQPRSPRSSYQNDSNPRHYNNTNDRNHSKCFQGDRRDNVGGDRIDIITIEITILTIQVINILVVFTMIIVAEVL